MKAMENTPEMRLRFIRIRERVKLSQRQMSKKMGLSDSFYGKLETGRSKITKNTLITIQYVFGVRPEYLSEGIEPIFDEDVLNIQEITGIYNGLSPVFKKCLFEYSHFLLERNAQENGECG